MCKEDQKMINEYNFVQVQYCYRDEQKAKMKMSTESESMF